LHIERFRLKIPPQPKYHLLAVIKREHFALIVKSRRRHHLAQRDGAVLASEQCSYGSKALFLLVPIQHRCLRGGFFLFRIVVQWTHVLLSFFIADNPHSILYWRVCRTCLFMERTGS